MATKYPKDTPLSAEQRALVEENLSLALAFVARRFKQVSHQVKDELIGAAYEGLVRAAQTFDPGKGTAFSTHAWWWMRCYIRDACRQWKKHSESTSSIEDIGRKHGERTYDVSESPETDQADYASLEVKCRRVLNSRSWEVIRLRFFEKLTRLMIAEKLGVSIERVRQIEMSALRSLRLNFKTEEVV